MMGPNTVSGHLSVIYTTECQINFTMRVIAPIVRSLRRSSFLPQLSAPVDRVVVTPEAARKDDGWVQSQAKKIVWSTGCSSWFIDPKTGRNTQMYPDWQWKFWIRSFWYPTTDFAYGASKALKERKTRDPESALPSLLGVLTIVAGVVVTLSFAGDSTAALLQSKGLSRITSIWETVSA